jgi:penicillin-binding protein 1A
MSLTIANPRSRHPLLVGLRALLALVVAAALAGAVGAVGLYAFFARGLPDIPDFSAFSLKAISTLRAADRTPIGEVYDEKRYIVPWESIPRSLIDALLATEDASFFEHGGIDLKGVARAAWLNLQAGHVVSGGSTITQQVAKSFIGKERKLWRKVREAILARRMEDLYSKEQILLLYLNRSYLGHNAYGVQAAAVNYFRKNVSELTLAEAALLAGTFQSPGVRNPWSDPEGARTRAEHVLARMVETGRLTEGERRAALEERPRVHPILDTLAAGSPYFASWVWGGLDSRFPGWRESGLQVWTSADLALTRRAERALREGIMGLGRLQGYHGPLGRVEGARAEQVFEREARRFLNENPDLERALVPARVVTVDRDSAQVQVTEELKPTLRLKDATWAARYTEFPWDAQHRRYQPVERVSFKGEVKDLRDVLRERDLVVIRQRRDPPPRPKPGVPAPGATFHWELADLPGPEGALLAVDPATGEVPVMLGGFDFDRSQANRTLSVRQTGSSIKPLFYSLAYSLGLAPSQVFSGTPYREGEYSPTGPRGDDDLTVWKGLALSKNAISLRVARWVLDRAPLPQLQSWAAALGLTTPLGGFLAEVLGANQSMDDLLNPSCTFLRYGEACPRTPVYLVTDREGAVLEDHRVPWLAFNRGEDTLAGFLNLARQRPEPRIPPEVAELMVENLRQVVQVGTATRAKALNVPAGGKTGTLPYDVWFVGFLDDLVAAAWIGQDRNQRYLGREKKRSGVLAAPTVLPVWTEFMAARLETRAPAQRAVRILEGLTWPKVDPVSGLLDEEAGVVMPHLRGSEPTLHAEDLRLQEFDPAEL